VRLHRLITMAYTTLQPADLAPHHTLTDLIDRHGTRTVLRALAAVLIRRRARPGTVDLPDHLRRDIGLPERGQPPPALRGPMM